MKRYLILGIFLISFFMLGVTTQAVPSAGFVCNPVTKECYFDLIAEEDGELDFPGCVVYSADNATSLRDEGYKVVDGLTLRKRKAGNDSYEFCPGEDFLLEQLPADQNVLTPEPEVAPEPIVQKASTESVPVQIINGEDAPSSGLTQQIEGFNLVGYSEGGQKSWDIKGDTADIRGNDVAVVNVDANAYGDKDMNLKADQGTLNKATGDVHLRENVVITSEDGDKMMTDSLQWQRNNDLVQTDDVVTITNADMNVVGTGLEAHPSMKAAKLISDVTANISTNAPNLGADPADPKKDNRIQINSDGSMELDQIRQIAVFRENVVAIELSTDRKLVADMMEVKFDDKTKRIKEILCTGNVELHQGGNVTYSDMLVYKADEQRMVLTGKPKVLIDPGAVDTKDIFKY